MVANSYRHLVRDKCGNYHRAGRRGSVATTPTLWTILTAIVVAAVVGISGCSLSTQKLGSPRPTTLPAASSPRPDNSATSTTSSSGSPAESGSAQQSSQYKLTLQTGPRSEQNCGQHATGRVQAFLENHGCAALVRSLYSAVASGRNVQISAAIVTLTDPSAASAFVQLVLANDTGDVTTLPDGGISYPGGPSTFVDRATYVVKPLDQAGQVGVLEAQWSEVSTERDHDPTLTAVLNYLAEQLASGLGTATASPTSPSSTPPISSASTLQSNPPLTAQSLMSALGSASCTQLGLDSNLLGFYQADGGYDCRPPAGLPATVLFLTYTPASLDWRTMEFNQGVADLPSRAPCTGSGINPSSLPQSIVCPPTADAYSRVYWLDVDGRTYVRIADDRHSLPALLRWLSNGCRGTIRRVIGWRRNKYLM